MTAGRWVLLGLLVAAGVTWITLGLGLDDVWPQSKGRAIAGRFLARAVSPALSYEGEAVAGRAPLLIEALEALGETVRVAAAGVGLALLLGVVLGFLTSTSWWHVPPTDALRARDRLWIVLRRTLLVLARGITALLRSIHELLWAVLLLAAFGLSPQAAVVALALPYAGIFAKIFSEMIDEVPREPARALQAAGAGGVQTYAVALLPQALPDLIAYTMYRFECALRSAAVLGFFGATTMGYLIKQSFSSGYYGEVWTYLYLLMIAVLLSDVWSGAVRRRLVMT